MLEDKKEKYREFREWQKMPHHVKPMSEDEHDCPTCGRHYIGNFCPQCGQSSKIGRYSIKNALLLYLDVWGLGNRGMFRTIRDLFLRPGYMIHDYLSGMQMAYFPPFKMLFLICTLSLLVNTGLNIKGENRFATEKEKLEKEYEASQEQDKQAAKEAKTSATGQEETAKKDSRQDKLNIDAVLNKYILRFNDFQNTHRALFQLILLIPYTGLLYFVFRHSPNIPDMRFSEFFVAMVYITNLEMMITTVMDIFWISTEIQLALSAPVHIIPLKQLSGYGYIRCILAPILSILITLAIFVIAGLAFAIIYYLT